MSSTIDPRLGEYTLTDLAPGAVKVQFESRGLQQWAHGRTDFESALTSQLANGDTPTASGGTVARSLEPTNMNGNNVNLDEETVSATGTGLRYQLALNALDGKYSLLRTALKTT